MNLSVKDVKIFLNLSSLPTVENYSNDLMFVAKKIEDLIRRINFLNSRTNLLGTFRETCNDTIREYIVIIRIVN